jgi:hypothetical protein
MTKTTKYRGLARQNGNSCVVVKLSRSEILNSLEKGARDRVGMSARLMLRRHRQGRLPDPSRVSDLIALSNLLRKNDPLLAQ